MALSPGTRLGPYEVISPLGAGGMGEVFKARDTRLGRTVAIKVLPAEFAEDAHLKTRFEREAKTISQLNHPNICALYDVGENYLVMELLEGETLADRLGRGPLPLDQVLRYGVQVAEALDRAHQSRIVHRDLKPGNIMITKSGAKLLDFGLAKSATRVIASENAATEQKPLTEEGAIVGTMQYMAPEQIEGAEADARTDLFALGQVLYEMATGRRAFSGKTRSSLIASIVAAQPQPISASQPLTPPAFEAVVARCLEKDPNDRWQCASDLAWALARIERSVAAAPKTRRQNAVPWLIAALAVIGATIAAFRSWRPAETHALASRFNFDVPAGWFSVTELKSGPPAISPDGRSIVFVGTDALSGRRALWLRRTDDVVPHLIEGTDDAARPFWSPDSRSVAFFSDNNNKVKRIDIAGGPPQLVCETLNGRGGTWGSNGWIVFAPAPFTNLVKVEAGGGTPQPLTKLDATDREMSHRWPFFMPDGKHFFYAARRVIPDASKIFQDKMYIADFETGTRKFLFEASSNILYAEPGWVLFTRDRTLFAQHFDPKRLEISGDPIPIVSSLQFHPSGFGMFSVSQSTLVYQAGTMTAHLEIYDRATDRTTPRLDAAEEYSFPRFSRDGRQVVYDIADGVTGNQDVWLFDRTRRVARRLTNSAGDDFAPQLSADGSRLYFTSNRAGTPQIYVKPVDGGEEKVLHVARSNAEFVSSLAPDGRHLVFVSLGAAQNDLHVLSLPEAVDTPFCATSFDEIQPQFSPDGRYVAFASNESGRYEVYIAPFPAATPHTQISTNGGLQPTWRGDGREMYYLDAGGRLMSVAVDTGGPVTVGVPNAITTVALRPTRNSTREYDVSADGKTFLFNSAGSGPRSVPFTVVLNWTEDLRH